MSLSSKTILVIDDDEPGQENKGDASGMSRPNQQPGTPSQTALTIDLVDDEFDGFDSDDFLTEDEFQALLTDHEPMDDERTRTLGSAPNARSSRISTVRLRNGPITCPLISLDKYSYGSIMLHPKVSVELYDGDFMRVVHIIQNTLTSAITLRGWMMRRTRLLNGLLERKINELCWILHIDEDDAREPKVQAMEEVEVTQVLKRRMIKLTNQHFPALSWREGVKEDQRTIENDRVLVCRYKYICSFVNGQAREANKWTEKAIHRLRADECDKGCAIPDDELRYAWRGATMKSGACIDWLPGEQKHLHLEAQPSSHIVTEATGRQGSGHLIARRASDAILVEDFDSLKTPSNRSEFDFPLNLDLSSSSRQSAERIHTKLIDLTNDDSISPKEQQPALPFRQISPEVTEIEGQIRAKTRTGILIQEYSTRTTSYPFANPTLSSATRPGDSRHRYPLSQAQKRSLANEPPEIDDVEIIEKPRSKIAKLPSLNLGSSRSSSVKDLAATCRDEVLSKRTNPHRYTFGDAFCGAGGMSRGAVMAGLRPDWAFDFNLPACNSYKLNFFETRIYNIWAHEFTVLEDDHKVDVLHLSPPCQFFSDAHTVQGKDDDMNIASLFAIGELLKKAKPRVVTLEQTSGLLRRHPEFLYAAIVMFTARGFSIRWRLFNCADFGLPQKRLRLFMLASCPGEVLPTFPKPTHSSNPTNMNLKLWTTVNQIIGKIPLGWANHELEHVRKLDKPPGDGDQLAHCITTSGAGMIHPSGKRDLTHREFASIQGFPLEHRFSTTGVKRQIGNAVPSIVAKVLLEEIKKALQKADGI